MSGVENHAADSEGKRGGLYRLGRIDHRRVEDSRRWLSDRTQDWRFADEITGTEEGDRNQKQWQSPRPHPSRPRYWPHAARRQASNCLEIVGDGIAHQLAPHAIVGSRSHSARLNFGRRTIIPPSWWRTGNPACPDRQDCLSSTEGSMAENRVYKLVEIVGTSDQSFAKAVSLGVERASKSLRNLDWFEVTEMRGRIEKGRVAQYQVKIKVGFRRED